MLKQRLEPNIVLKLYTTKLNKIACTPPILVYIEKVRGDWFSIYRKRWGVRNCLPFRKIDEGGDEDEGPLKSRTGRKKIENLNYI